MTRAEAIQLAADWWYSIIRSGTWDNGDAGTEATRSVFASMAYQPTEEDFAKVKEGLPGMVEGVIANVEERWSGGSNRFEIYADYGCGPLDGYGAWWVPIGVESPTPSKGASRGTDV